MASTLMCPYCGMLLVLSQSSVAPDGIKEATCPTGCGRFLVRWLGQRWGIVQVNGATV